MAGKVGNGGAPSLDLWKVGSVCIHQRNAREAARRAHLDAFGANRGAPWRDPTNGG